MTKMDSDTDGFSRRFHRTFSFRKINKGFDKNGRNMVKKQNHLLKKSASTSQVGRLADNRNVSLLDEKMSNQSLSVGNLKKNSSFRKSFSTRLKSLPSFRWKFHDTDLKTELSVGKQRKKEDEAMTLFVDKIRLHSLNRKDFRKRMMRRFRSHSHMNEKEDTVFRKQTTCSNISAGGMKSGTKGLQKCAAASLTLKLKSRITAASEEVDFTDLIKPVIFNKKRMLKMPKLPIDNQTRLPKEILKPTMGDYTDSGENMKPDINDHTYSGENRTPDLDDSENIAEFVNKNNCVSKTDKADVITNDNVDSAKPELSDSTDNTADTRNTQDMMYRDNGLVAIVECSSSSSSPSTVSPTCADIYGQDEGVDMSFTSSNDHSLSSTSYDPLLKDKTNDLVLMPEPNVSVTDETEISENDFSIVIDNGEEKASCDKGKNDQGDKIPLYKQNYNSVKDDLSNILQQDRCLQLKDVRADNCEAPLGYDEVDNPWVLRTDLSVLSEMRQENTLKSMNFISEYSVDDSMGFNVNQWNNFEYKGNIETSDNKDIRESSELARLSRNDSVESIDSFSSSIHSVHSEDLFFSASEPEMEPDQLSLSSGGSVPNTPLDKPKGLLKIEEADEQISPGVLQKDEMCEYKTIKHNNKNAGKDFLVKSLNDLNKSETNISSTPRRISSYLSGLKSFAFDLSEKTKASKHEKLNQRRSLDSNIKIEQMTLDLNMNESPTLKNKLTSSSESGLNNARSPVIEKGKNSSKKTRRRTVDVTADNDNMRFFTLPARRKTKSDVQDSPRRKVTRISSISKMFTDKAQSLSSMKLGSSFKLRNTDRDGDKSKVPSFLKTSSLTNLMAKKGAEMASSISTLIRGRSNSNTVVNSPFKQGKKPKQTNKEEKREFQYERVCVPCVRKRPATTEEISAWKKRLTLNVELANSLGAEESMRLRADSIVRRSHCSGTRLVRSPTLLDEIMKSVDNTRFRSLESAGEFDLDDSDDGDSSNEGTGYNIFTKQASVCSGGLSNYQLKQEVLLTLCRKCGNVLNGATDTNMTKQIEDLLHSKHSHSLCDLRRTCKCIESQSRSSKANHHRYNSHRESFQNQSESATTSPQSSVVSDENSSISSPNSSQNSEIVHSSKFASMFELSDLTNHGPDKSEICTTDFDKECLELVGTGSGSLLRHKPMLDLSMDNLDVTDETDSGVVMYDMDRRSRERRSQSCDDVTTCDKLTPDGDSFYSCTDMMTDNDVQTPNTKPFLLPTTKSLSCDDILNETENTLIDSALKHEEKTQHQKEIRKAKVKSLSSSHDALSMFVNVESLDLDIDAIITSQGVETEEIKKLSNYISESFVSNTEPVKAANHDKASEMCDESLNICDKNEHQKECENDKNKNASTIFNGLKQEFGKNITDVEDSQNSDRRRTLSERMDKGATLSTKPPLPRKTHRKVLSVNDIKLQCDTNVPTFLKRNKRYSMIEMSGKQSAEHLSELETKSKQSDNKIVQKFRVKSQSCDYINSTVHLGSKVTDSQTINARKFLFSEEHIQSFTLKNPKSEDKHTSIQKSVSSGNVPTESFSSPLSSNSSYSMVSLNRLSNQSYSDDVFQRLSSISPPQVVLSPPEKLLSLDGFIDFSGTHNAFSRLSELPTPEVMPDVSSVPDMDTVLKYDINLGFLLHSIQCDNRIVCFYSFQRNKQLMESVITPLAVPPDVQHKRSNESNHVNTPKLPNKSKSEDLPNPAAPITSVPSERLLHAGHVLRTVLLARAPHMIRDRKFHLRTYRRCMVGTEMVDWLMQQCSLVHSRNQAVGMWQALVEEGVVVHVCHEHQFKNKYLFYRFHEDDEGVSTVPSNSSKRECEDELQEMFLMLAQIGPDAMMRMILRKLPHERTMEDLEIIYEELLHIKALSHLSTMVKRELASVLVFESHAKSGTVLFNQGDEGKSWYIILKGSVNVVIYGKGVVCTLHEGDDFGKLALVNDAPRAATIVLRDDNCHFLRVDKDDFNRILRDVEANTVRLKEHGQDVLVLEKIPSNTQTSDGTVHAHYKYSVMAGTPEKMLEHLLETRLDNKKEDEIDGFLEDFILTHVIFMPCNHLCPVLLSHYHSSATETTEQEAFEFMINHKKCVLHFVQEWGNIVGPAFKEDHTINAFLEELHSCVLDDLVSYPSLRDELVTLDMVLSAQIQTTEGKTKKRTSALSRKPSSKEAPRDSQSQKISIRHTDENIFKVYCADHTYSTLKLSMDTTVENLLLNIKEKLGLGDELILCEVKSSGERIILKENDLSVTSGLSINGRLFVTPREHLDALTPLPEQEGPSDGTFTTIEMFSSREMAYYMTLYDWELFTSVQEYELIYQVFGRYKFQKITANLDLFLRRFNEIQFWIVTEMVLTTTLSKRVALLRKFIKLAAHCKEFQNLNSFFAVVMGLSNIAVSRLSQTWEKLPSKFKKMFVEFETLMDPSRNHRVYRLTVAKMAPPILPFMPLLMKDMTFTHEGNKTYFDGLVNFEKMRMISQTLKTVRFCRSSNIDLEMPGSTKSADAMSYIRNLHVIDNQRLLTQLSHKLEPRKT